MSDDENNESAGKPFCIERAKQGRAKCKKCKQSCAAKELRIAKLVSNPFGDGLMKQWYHVNCLFEQFLSQRATTKRIEESDDIDGWDDLDDADKQNLLKHIEESEKKFADKLGVKYSPKKTKQKPKDKPVSQQKNKNDTSTTASTSASTVDPGHKDNLFREFRRLVAEVTNESSYLEKSAIMNKMFTKGSDGTGFKGDLIQWVRLLIPGVIKRIYNLQSKQLIKLFSVLFDTNREDMMEHLEQGDIGETILHFFENSNTIKPCKKSLLSIQEVDNFLEELSKLTKEEEQTNHFKKIIKKCTGNDLKIIIRLIKHDLRMNAGAKHVLDAVHADAYSAFQSSRDLSFVLKKILGNEEDISSSDSKEIKASIKIMTPVLPMLAEACKSVEQAMKKCPNGMYSEIKYDGERVQVHKCGSEFKYFSRSLKPVLPHKVNHFKKYIPQAFPHAKDLILDSEVLLIDTQTGKPLPFGSLGVHKKEEFKDANVCLFVFDCIYYNGESLGHKPIKERRKILKENMTEIQNHVMFSEMEEIHKPKDLAAMIAKVLNLGLEGLVLKDIKSIYEPGKRHWLKVKKDYLLGGAMADSADLIVLGAWYGTGKKGGMMSVFLMGCYDKYSQKFCTVTKVHTGHDDKTLEQLQTELDMIKINFDVSNVPSWLKCTKTMIPDFVARDPKKQPVWEITGAEFTQHVVHTADGISIRFPRVTRIRSDKTWETATSLEELKTLYKNSKENADYSSLLKVEDDDDDDEKPPKAKQVKMDDYIKNEKSPKKIKQEKDEPGSSKARKKTINNYAAIIKEAEKDKIKEEKPNKLKRSSDVQEVKPSKKIKAEKDAPHVIRYPDIFTNIKLLALDNVLKDNEALIRHFIACDGDLLNEEQWETATHVVHTENSVSEKEARMNFLPSSRHITVDWIKDSIGNNELQDTRPYTVQWITS